MEELFSSPALNEVPLSLHLGMIQDRIRMRAFSDAIRAVIEPGHTVVDVGSGTGVLSILAARCGARQVIGLERTEMIRFARKIKNLNCPDAPISYRARDVLIDELPNLQADVLICELLGNFGIDESMVEVLSRVRRKLLKPGGHVIPQRLELVVAPVQCARAYRESLSWKRLQHGIDFSPLQELAYHAVYQINDESVRLMAKPRVIAEIDFATVTHTSHTLRTNFEIARSGTVHGIAGWFRCTLAPGHVIDTGPGEPETHWGQVLLPVGEPISIRRADQLGFEFRERVVGTQIRWYWKGAVKPAGHSDEPTRFSYQASRDFSG